MTRGIKQRQKNLAMTSCKENCDIIVIFPVYGQFGAIGTPDSGRIVCKVYIFFNSNFVLYKNWKQNWKIKNAALTLLIWVKVLFCPKNADLLQKSAGISKIKKALVLKGIHSETTYVCVLTCQI